MKKQTEETAVPKEQKKESKPKASDALNASTFSALLREFNDLIENPTKDMKPKFDALKSKAENNILTGAQRSAIYDRCENYLNGRYGSSINANPK